MQSKTASWSAIWGQKPPDVLETRHISPSSPGLFRALLTQWSVELPVAGTNPRSSNWFLTTLTTLTALVLDPTGSHISHLDGLKEDLRHWLDFYGFLKCRDRKPIGTPWENPSQVHVQPPMSQKGATRFTQCDTKCWAPDPVLASTKQ